MKPYEEQGYWRDVGHGAGVLGRPHGPARANRRASTSTTGTGRSARASIWARPRASSGATWTTFTSASPRWSSGATIRNSILGRSVWVDEGAVIEDSIVMDHTTVGKGARLRRAIVDRFDIIPADSEIGVDPAIDRRRHYVGPFGDRRRAPRRPPGVPARAGGVLRVSACPPPARSSSTATSTSRRARTPGSSVVEVQDSAAPVPRLERAHHRRVLRAQRRAPACVDADDRIIDIVNNYARISFNFGPDAARLAGRRRARRPPRRSSRPTASAAERRGGHGNAIAQVYNHMIMPLA